VLCALAGVVIGCRKASSPIRIAVDATGEISQVLRQFQMQDIVNGNKNLVVESPEGRVSEKQHIASVDKPRITFFKNGDLASTLMAPQGKVMMDTHEVLVWGGVTVVSQDSSTLKTDKLRYDPKTQHLLSDDPVRLEKSDSITVGTGLDATPDLSRVKIGHEKVYVKKRPA
jgi:LPS export ABC transporter protein LptC